MTRPILAMACLSALRNSRLAVASSFEIVGGVGLPSMRPLFCVTRSASLCAASRSALSFAISCWYRIINAVSSSTRFTIARLSILFALDANFNV